MPSMQGRELHTFAELASFFRVTKTRVVFLSHEPERVLEAREFAAKLKEKGFEALVAADFRKNGEAAVEGAIRISQFTIVLAFDDKTVDTCAKNAVPVIDMRAWET